MKIYITGIGGFLGSAIAADLRAAGHTVDGARRGAQIDPSTLDGVDALIHAAHDFTPGAARRNIDIATAWFRAARDHAIPHQIFLSSCSAGADSEYGRIKQALEPVFLDSGHTVLRPGLVLGNGGLAARQRAAILRSPIIPMIGGGIQPTAILPLTKFLAVVRLVLDRHLPGAFNLYEIPMPTYRELVTRIKSEAGQRPRFLNVPVNLALSVTAFFERLHLPFPIKPGQIRALSQGPAGPSDLPRLLA